MDERLRCVARLLDGEKMAAPCREFDVSRKTGYKIVQRYKDCGLERLYLGCRAVPEKRTVASHDADAAISLVLASGRSDREKVGRSALDSWPLPLRARPAPR